MKNLFVILVVIFLMACENDPAFVVPIEADNTINPDSTNLTESDSLYSDEDIFNDGQNSKPDSETTENTENEQPDETLPVCGNGIIEAGEACDMDFKNCANISDKYMPDKQVRCKNDCSGYDENECTLYCGNGILDNNEYCELKGTFTCSNLGTPFISSDLLAPCSPVCNGFNVSTCACMEQYKEYSSCVMVEMAKKECGTIYSTNNECWVEWVAKIHEAHKQESTGK